MLVLACFGCIPDAGTGYYPNFLWQFKDTAAFQELLECVRERDGSTPKDLFEDRVRSILWMSTMLVSDVVILGRGSSGGL